MNRASMKIKVMVINKLLSRNISAVRGTGKKAPSIEEFDTLNPGEWQLGAEGKIFPRLPEGTKAGKLTMGEYGMYKKDLIDGAMKFSEAAESADSSAYARPKDSIMTYMNVFMTYLVVVLATLQGVQLFTGVCWPWTLKMKKE